MPNLNYTIIRPAIVYGLGDFRGLTSRMVMAAVYKKRKEKMKLLWNAKLKQNTVHINDLCRAIVHCRNMDTGEIFNLTDDNTTDQGKINTHLQKIFGIKTGFHGKILSKLALSAVEDICQEANDKHMQPWSEMCMGQGIESPLSPMIEIDQLLSHHVSMDNSKIKASGLNLLHPTVERQELELQLSMLREMGIFPQI